MSATSAPGGTPSAPLRAVVEELVAAGVRDAVVCPGSRSTPMALALAAHPALRLIVHLDERGAGFLAVGLAKVSRRTVVVLVTSGTAAANLLPAAVEAYQARVPVLLLTADRPPELRDRGAPQTIDQVGIFGRFVRWAAELPVPSDDETQTRHLRHVVSRAVAMADGAPAGPVHLDLPYREPLLPHGPLSPQAPASRSDAPRSFTRVVRTRSTSAEVLDRLTGLLARAQRPIVWCGPIDRPGFADGVTRFAARVEAPVLADGLANVRTGRHDRSRVIIRSATLLRSTAFTDGHRPDLVIRFGGTPTSRSALEWLATCEAEHLIVDEAGWDEPTFRAATLLRVDPVELTQTLAIANDLRETVARDWLEAWRRADAAVDRAIREALGTIGDEPFEGAVFAELGDALPDGAILWVGSSMPVRDLDLFLPGGPTDLRCLANRGANGIDGVVSSALGAAVAGPRPVVLVIGDISFLHDINALAAARIPHARITVLLVDNDGGGIFSFLPQASASRPDIGLPARFEQLLGTPHGTDLAAVARALGATVTDVRPGAVGRSVAQTLDLPGVKVLRLRTDRSRNVELHARVLGAAIEAIG